MKAYTITFTVRKGKDTIEKVKKMLEENRGIIVRGVWTNTEVNYVTK